MKECPHCGFKVREGTRFCPQCGGILILEGTPEAEEQEKTSGFICPYCQAHLRSPDQKFCNHCGRKLSPEKGAEVPRSEPPSGVPSPEHPAGLQGRRFSWFIAALIIIAFLGGGGFAWAYFQGYLLDTSPPRVEIKSPSGDKEIILQPGKEVGEAIEVAASDDRRLKRVELYLNGALVKQFERWEPFVYKWSTNEERKYTFQAFAYDSRGNRGGSAPVTIKVTAVEVGEVAGEVADVAGEVEKIRMAIYGHYENIPGNLILAYSYFSARYQGRTSLEGWLKSFPDTISDTVERVDVVYLSPSRAVAEIEMTSRDDAGGGEVLVRKWAGKWYLVKEGGEWKLDEPEIKKVAEYYE